MKTKSFKYIIEWGNGEKETVKIPAFIQPSVVKKQLAHAHLEMVVERGYHTYINDTRVDGPVIVEIGDNGDLLAFRQ